MLTKKSQILVTVLAAILASSLLLAAGCGDDDPPLVPPDPKPPTIQSVTCTPSSVAAGGIVTVSVVATDPDDDPLTYSYTPNGGAISGTGSTVAWTVPNTAGAYSVSVTVSDGSLTSEPASGSVTVTPQVTSVIGAASLPIGSPGTLSNAKVSLYTSYDNWLANQPVKFAAVNGTGASVTFTLSDNIAPGNYYLDVWKDADGSGGWSEGDFVGWYGSGGLGSPSLTEFSVTEGQTASVGLIDMFEIILAAQTERPHWKGDGQ